MRICSKGTVNIDGREMEREGREVETERAHGGRRQRDTGRRKGKAHREAERIQGQRGFRDRGNAAHT